MTTPPVRPAANTASADRRRHKRFNVWRPGKVFRRAMQKYEPVRTRNLSFSGALLELEPSRPLGVGELLDVAIAFRDSPVVDSATMVRAIVTRVEPAAPGPGQRQAVAVRYIQPR